MSTREFQVHMHAYANASVTVKLTEDDIQTYLDGTGMAGDGVTVKTVTVAQLRDLIEDRAYEDTPSICAQCSGWGQQYSMDLGDWEPDEDQPGITDTVVEVTK